MLQPHLGKSFCERRLATRPYILLLAVVQVGIIQVFCSSHRFRLAHITAFLYKFSYGLRNRVSDNALCVVHLRNFWELVVKLHQFSCIMQGLGNNGISLIPDFILQVRVLLVIQDGFIERKKHNPFLKSIVLTVNTKWIISGKDKLNSPC